MMSKFKETFPEYVKYDSRLEDLVCVVKAKANEFNITSIKDHDGIWEKHVIDSLMILKVPIIKDLLSRDGIKVLDIGTGAGFPGLPLAITHPEVEFVLLDSTLKKIKAVDDFIEKLQLKNVKAVWGRAEELVKDVKYRGKFDLVTTRAVAYLPKLLEISKPFIKPTGYIAAYKSLIEEEKTEGLKKAGFLRLMLFDEYKYSLPSGNPLLKVPDRVIYTFKLKS